MGSDGYRTVGRKQLREEEDMKYREGLKARLTSMSRAGALYVMERVRDAQAVVLAPDKSMNEKKFRASRANRATAARKG